MLPFVEIFGQKIPLYPLMTYAGLITSFIFVSYHLIQLNAFKKYALVYFYCLIGAGLGAKSFGVLSVFFNHIYNKEPVVLSTLFYESGIVYLGGLLGYLLLLKIWSRIRKLDFKMLENLAALGIPLFHIFGRIGCYFAGCCYGRYINLTLGQKTIVFQLPVQLMEAAFEGGLFILLFKWYKAGEKDILNSYLFCYSVIRFLLEFCRGDTVRGIYFGISFSQIICVIVIAVIIFQGQKRKKK